MPAVIAALLAAAAALCLFALSRQRVRPPGQPPVVSPKLPVIGHIVGILRHPMRYVSDLSIKHGHPIFQLPLGLPTVYVVQDPALLYEIDRSPRAFSLWPIEVSTLATLGNLDARTAAFLKSAPFHSAWTKAMRRDVMTGAPLRSLMEDAATRIAAELAPTAHASGSQDVELFAWVRRAVTRATMRAIYGPENPYDAADVEAALTDLLDDAFWIMLGPVARWAAPKGYHGREAVVRALARYFESGGHRSAALVVRDRQRVYAAGGLSAAQQGRVEATLASALVGNTYTAAFWVLQQVLADAALHADVRAEAKRFVTPAAGAGAATAHRLDLDGLRRSPLLTSVIHETLRCHAGAANSRQVMHDTLLGGQWMLRRGALVFAPLHAVHSHAGAWGASAAEFQPRRFAGDGVAPGRHAFRAFGAGPSVCPGQALATSMIATLVAMCCLQFDIEPAGPGGWVRPGADSSNFFEIVPTPQDSVNVRVAVREGWAGGRWEFAE